MKYTSKNYIVAVGEKERENERERKRREKGSEEIPTLNLLLQHIGQEKLSIA